MIKQSTLTAIGPVVDRLAAANVALGAGDGSILGACFMSGLTPVSDHYEGNTGWNEAWLNSLVADTLTGAGSHFTLTTDDDSTIFIPSSHHSVTMEEASDYVAAIGKSVLATARNVVKPTILKIIESVECNINNRMAPIEPISIIDVRLIKEWETNTVKALLNEYRAMASTKVQRHELAKLDRPEGLAAHMVTGSSEIDTLFQSVLAETGLTVDQVFDSIFKQNGTIGEYSADWYINRNLYLAQLLFVSIASDNPWPGSNLGKMEWETLMNQLANALGGQCCAMYNKFMDDIKAGILFIRSEGNNVWLIGEVYDKFLEAGGSPEVIIGKCVGKDWIGLTSDQILGKKEDHLTAWRAWHAAQRYQEESGKIANIRSAFYEAICAFIDDGDKTQIKLTRNELLTAASNRCNALQPSHCNDMASTAIHVVCDVFYSHLPSKELILRINQLVEGGEDGEVAAGTAISEYINDWICAQILYEKN